jgi:hypothetical protein
LSYFKGFALFGVKSKYRFNLHIQVAHNIQRLISTIVIRFLREHIIY